MADNRPVTKMVECPEETPDYVGTFDPDVHSEFIVKEESGLEIEKIKEENEGNVGFYNFFLF